MLKALILGASLSLAAIVSASALPLQNPATPANPAVTRVAEGCGPGFWRGPGGRCHPYARERACPRGYHLGREGRRCWPN